MAFTIDEGGWDIEGLSPVSVGQEEVRKEAVPYLADPKAWEQFSDMELYQAERLFRDWHAEMTKVPKWSRDRMARRYMFSQLFELIYKRKYLSEESDRKLQNRLTKLFAYYSTSISKSHYDRNSHTQKSKTSYHIRGKSLDDIPPYSLRMRLEWLEARGLMPNGYNMKLPKNDLKPGHSIYPSTDANMEKRREQSRERYREYVKVWRDSQADGE